MIVRRLEGLNTGPDMIFFHLNCLGMMREIVSLPLQAINVELMGIFY